MSEELCVCRRSKLPKHCPFCGLRNFYSLRNLSFTMPRGDGSSVVVKTFRCRGCGEEFNEFAFDNCKAPKKPLSIAAQRAMDGVSELSYDERKRLSLEALAKHGRNAPGIVREAIKNKPFEIGDDRELLQQAMKENLEEIKDDTKTP